MLELIINVCKDEKENQEKKMIMLVQNGILVEKHEEHNNKKRLEGNIYNGKAQNVIQGMQSAFIDIGANRNTFIRLKDLLPKVDEAKEKEYLEKIEKMNIKDVVKQGSYIPVQVKRDGTDKKGARVSTHINLPGRYTVLMPNTNFITVSQKIENEDEKQRLVKILEEVLPENMGAIIRTAGEKIKKEEIVKDIKALLKKWEVIEKKLKNSDTTEMVYDNKALLRRTVIDIIDHNLNKIIVNNKGAYEDVLEILKDMEVLGKIEVVLKDKEDLLKMYELEKQIEKMESRKIWLKSGGFITIDRTEALTAIDINTGKYTGTKNLEQTVYNVNKEATEEIAKQLRLRDIGGIIIIDYIDMTNKENEKEILKILNECLKEDRTKCQVLGFTKLNLLEMTRKNMCNNDNY